MIKSAVMWLHILVVPLYVCMYVCVCHTVWEQSTPEQCNIYAATSPLI